MEKKLEFCSTTTLPFFVIFFLLVTLTQVLSRGLGTDQATSLMALRRAKMHARSVPAAVELSSMQLTFDDARKKSFDVGKMEDDLMKDGLPGQPSPVLFKQYAGYVNIDKVKGRSLFYYFAEAARDPSTKPLILWLNGGPGCSSLGFGAMMELGPFGVNRDGKTLYARKYAWNIVANTLFLESPAGVGFSYSNTSSDYELSGDRRTTEDTYTFLLNWFKKFPHYKDRDLYIMGESYAGYYVPELADVIIKRNGIESTSQIHLKGIMIGNGIMNDVTDVRGTYDFLWSHALISDETYRSLKENCMVEDRICEEYEAIGKTEFGTIDLSNIYGPTCSGFGSRWSRKIVLGYDPCEGDYITSYLNLPHVQEAMHANQTKLPHSWELCSDVIANWKDSPSTMFPTYRRLIASGLRILLFSGDVDVIVSVTSTRYSIDAMKLRVIKPWRPWLDLNNEVGGYQVEYEGLTFATVRDAGHQVPEYQPQRAFALLMSFLMGVSSGLHSIQFDFRLMVGSKFFSQMTKRKKTSSNCMSFTHHHQMCYYYYFEMINLIFC